MTTPFRARVRRELLLFNQDRQNLLMFFESHESCHNFLLCYFCFQFQCHQNLADFPTFTTEFYKKVQNDNSETNFLQMKQDGFVYNFHFFNDMVEVTCQNLQDYSRFQSDFWWK